MDTISPCMVQSSHSNTFKYSLCPPDCSALSYVMWDKEYGGFHNLVSKTGEPIAKKGEEKTAYGNAFGLYGLAAYARASQNEEALELAKKTFYWLEEHSHDSISKAKWVTIQVMQTRAAG